MLYQYTSTQLPISIIISIDDKKIYIGVSLYHNVRAHSYALNFNRKK